MLFLLKSPRIHQVSGPKAHARAYHRTSGADDGRPGCCVSNVSASGGRPKHTMMHFGGITLDSGEQSLKGSGLPHKRSAWVHDHKMWCSWESKMSWQVISYSSLALFTRSCCSVVNQGNPLGYSSFLNGGGNDFFTVLKKSSP